MALTLQYQNKPPLRRLPLHEFVWAGSVIKKHTKELQDANPNQARPNEEDAQWAERLDDTLEMLDEAPDDLGDGDGTIEAPKHESVSTLDDPNDPRQRWAYFFDGRPAGIAEFDISEQPLRIVAVVSHPLSTGVGGAIVEAAVKESVARGGGGKVQLKYLNDNAKAAYLKMGFTEEAQAPCMSLDPSQSKKWQLKDGEWRLAQYKDLQYATGFSPLSAKLHDQK